MQFIKYILLALILACIGAFANENGMQALRELEEKKISVARENQDLGLDIESLERTVAKLRTDPRTVELAANRKLGMIRQDETIYVFRSADRRVFKAVEADSPPAGN